MSINKLVFSVFFCFILGLVSVQAQDKKGDLVDGIAAVIGDEIILESEVMEQYNTAKSNNPTLDKCTAFESILSSKLLVHAAKQDTLIEPRTEAIAEQVEQKYKQILASFPSEKEMLEAYKFRTVYDLKNVLTKLNTDQYYTSQKYSRLTDGVDVTPQEVSQFYDTYQYQLPDLKDEVRLSKIMIYPTLTDAHKQELIDKLKEIKANILNGEDFASQARIYSEGPSATNGGLMKDVLKGQMVKPFEAAALNLQVGEISDPIETEFGFHIIRLEKKIGKKYDASHILLLAKPTQEEIDIAKTKLDSIKTLILSDKISFKDAAYKFSDDKATKYNAGLMQNRTDGSSRIEKEGLNADIAYQIAGLHKGDFTEVFENVTERDKKVVELIRLEDEIPAHKITLKTDYDKLKQYAIREKQNKLLDEWVTKEIPNTFISIDDRYKDCTFENNWTK